MRCTPLYEQAIRLYERVSQLDARRVRKGPGPAGLNSAEPPGPENTPRPCRHTVSINTAYGEFSSLETSSTGFADGPHPSEAEPARPSAGASRSQQHYVLASGSNLWAWTQSPPGPGTVASPEQVPTKFTRVRLVMGSPVFGSRRRWEAISFFFTPFENRDRPLMHLHRRRTQSAAPQPRGGAA